MAQLAAVARQVAGEAEELHESLTSSGFLVPILRLVVRENGTAFDLPELCRALRICSGCLELMRGAAAQKDSPAASAAG